MCALVNDTISTQCPLKSVLLKKKRKKAGLCTKNAYKQTNKQTNKQRTPQHWLAAWRRQQVRGHHVDNKSEVRMGFLVQETWNRAWAIKVELYFNRLMRQTSSTPERRWPSSVLLAASAQGLSLWQRQMESTGQSCQNWQLMSTSYQRSLEREVSQLTLRNTPRGCLAESYLLNEVFILFKLVAGSQEP